MLRFLIHKKLDAKFLHRSNMIQRLDQLRFLTPSLPPPRTLLLLWTLWLLTHLGSHLPTSLSPLPPLFRLLFTSDPLFRLLYTYHTPSWHPVASSPTPPCPAWASVRPNPPPPLSLPPFHLSSPSPCTSYFIV